MRFLGYGIGHKDQTKSAAVTNKDKVSGMQTHSKAKTVCRRARVMPPVTPKVHNTEAMEDSRSDNGETELDQDDSDVDSDEDLDGYF